MESRRKFTRIICEHAVWVEAGNISCSGRIQDLSLRGALVECEDVPQFQNGDNVTFRLKPNALFLDLLFEAEVVHSGGNLLGLKVTEISFGDFMKLRKMIEQKLGNTHQMVREVALFLNAF